MDSSWAYRFISTEAWSYRERDHDTESSGWPLGLYVSRFLCLHPFCGSEEAGEIQLLGIMELEEPEKVEVLQPAEHSEQFLFPVISEVQEAIVSRTGVHRRAYGQNRIRL